MRNDRYFMRDLNVNKIDSIMDFDIVLRRSRSRSVFEISVFLVALGAYLGVLGLSGG